MGFEALNEAVIKGAMDEAEKETQKLMEAGEDPQTILNQGLIAAMDIVGDRFAKGKMFVPQMLRSAKTMQQCVDLLKPHFVEGQMATKGKVIMGTVKGDLHDIGKNLVAMIMEGAGFTILDLGVSVNPETFVEKVQAEHPDILGLSALLSTTMPAMKTTIQALIEAGIRDSVKVMIGGAPVTAKFAEEIGADAYAPDAATAVVEAKKLLNIN
ncbi:MAG: corrinoid protein [Desulfobacteraceae bacterium]|jgi:corrinoid protein of di/trimethylamine methyltransferase